MIEAVNKQSEALFTVDLKHALIWVARALDYVGVDDTNHSHRVAYTAYHCAKQLGWEEKKQEFCFLAGLIHDCGVSQTAEHSHLVSDISPHHVKAHCLRGYNALRTCEVLEPFSSIVLYHHTDWTELQQLPISPYEKDIAALIYLADRLDCLRAHYMNNTHKGLIVLKKQQISEHLLECSGIQFKPELVCAMASLVQKDGFWFAMEPESIEVMPLRFKHLDWLERELTVDSLLNLARLIAGIVDAKSPFTYQHSIKVAELCSFLAKHLNCRQDIVTKLHIAGLVHDIGKLRTPDHILHKPGPLTIEEYTHIKRHTIDTKLALDIVFPGSKIAGWASDHHERLNGSGYPYNKTANELDLPSRILAVADVFQALSQNRPYRPRLSSHQIHTMMTKMVNDGELDGLVFQCIANNLEECYQLSISDKELAYA